MTDRWTPISLRLLVGLLSYLAKKSGSFQRLEEELARSKGRLERLGASLEKADKKRSALEQKLQAAETELQRWQCDAAAAEAQKATRFRAEERALAAEQLQRQRVVEDLANQARSGTEQSESMNAMLVERYLDLVEATVLNSIYQPGEHLESGQAWPKEALTMIGRKRLRQVREAAADVLRRGVPGDFIETGVWRGGAVIMMRAALDARGAWDRKVWAADSFRGIPAPDLEHYPADAAHEGMQHLDILTQNTRAHLETHLAQFSMLDHRTQILEGWFKDTLPGLPAETKFAVVRLDGDLYQSTWEGLSYLYPKLSPGGYLIVDDMSWEGCAAAVQEYRRQNGIADPMIPIDWTGEYWIKGAASASS